MCGALLSKFKRKNKYIPAPEISPELLEKAQRLLDQEKALLKNNIFTQTGANLASLRSEEKKNTGPTWFAYELGLDGNILHKGLKIKCPKKLDRDPKLPVLTREMLLDKQAQEEKNRNKEIEKKRKAAMKFVEVKQRKEEERMNKAARLPLKQVKPAEKRETHLDNDRVKSTASKASNNTRSRLSEAHSFAKAQQTKEQWERKMTSIKSKRQRAVEANVMKQRAACTSTESPTKIAKQVEEEIVQTMLDDLEVNPNFNASDSEHVEEGRQWDDLYTSQ